MKIFKGIAIPNSLELCLIKELASKTVYPDTSAADAICEIVNRMELTSKQSNPTNSEAIKRWYKIEHKNRTSYLNLILRELLFAEPKEYSEIIDIKINEQEIEKNVKKNEHQGRKLIEYLAQKETSNINKNLLNKLRKIASKKDLVFEKAGQEFFEISEKIRLTQDRNFAVTSIDRIYNEYLYDLNHLNNFTLPISRFSSNIFLLQSQMIFANWAQQNIYLQNLPTAIGFCERLIQSEKEEKKILQFLQFGNDYFDSANQYLLKAVKADDFVSHTQGIRISAHYFWVAYLIGLVIKNSNLNKENLEYSYLNAEEGWACCVTALTYKDYIYEHPNWFALVAKDSASASSNNFVRKYSSPTNPIIPRVMAEIYSSYGRFLIAEDKSNKVSDLNKLLSIRQENGNLGIAELQIIDLFLTEMFGLIGDDKSSNYFKEITIKRYLTYKMIGN